MTADHIELALTRHGGPFDCRPWLVVDRVSWGFNIHECDLVAVSSNGYAHEIEIKVSASDLRRDSKKRHGHRDQDPRGYGYRMRTGKRTSRITCFWFAVPEALVKVAETEIPVGAGLIGVDDDGRARRVRKPQRIQGARKLSLNEYAILARLGTIRYWAMRLRTGGE